jgi:hypothetical protein
MAGDGGIRKNLVFVEVDRILTNASNAVALGN